MLPITRKITSAVLSYLFYLSASNVPKATSFVLVPSCNNSPSNTALHASAYVPRRRGFLRRITGDATPYRFPVRSLTLERKWPARNNFEKYAFSRLDYYNDGIFYSLPRLVYHLDEPAICSITQYYRNNIPAGSDILDLCSSWVSHYPVEFSETMGRISAIGMNAVELACNDQLDDYRVVDLNQKSTLPYDDASFDAITCVASIDYLIDPFAVLRECRRVLRPRGKVLVSFSNRCFGLKAVKVWTGTKFPGQADIVNGYFQYAGGFSQCKAFDITAELPRKRNQDPVIVMEATKR